MQTETICSQYYLETFKLTHNSSFKMHDHETALYRQKKNARLRHANGIPQEEICLFLIEMMHKSKEIFLNDKYK